MSWSQYNQQYARESESAGASGGAGAAAGSQAAPLPTNSCNHSGCYPGQTLNKIIVPTIAPFALNHAAPEQNDIQNNFSTTQQYGQRFGLARAHF